MKIRVVFGEMGAGKSYTGALLAQRMGNAQYIEGDDFLPIVLKKKVEELKPLTWMDVDTFIRTALLPAMLEIARKKKDTVISQALYNRKHRALIETELKAAGVDVVFYYVKPASFRSHLNVLLKREKGLRWIFIMLLSRPWFEKPDHNTRTIHNDFLSDPVLPADP